MSHKRRNVKDFLKHKSGIPEYEETHRLKKPVPNISGNSRSKIFCYSICGSRKPEEVRLIRFNDREDAERNGYRICSHCSDKLTSLSEKREIVVLVTDIIRKNYGNRIDVSDLSRISGIGAKKISRAFLETMGITPKKYLEELRIIKLKEKLSSGQSVDNAIREIGHSSLSWLYSNSTSRLGMSPSTYRKGAKGETLKFAIKESQFGFLAASYTGRGICAVTLSDTREDAINYLKNEYPRAIFVETEDENHYLEGILEYLNGSDVTLPLDTEGTEFQKKVWSAIRKIPYGSTVTYSELASSIGRPNSFRAVANACATNPVPLIVPCHRVIRKNGDLGGYGLGLDRKRKILEFEDAKKQGKEKQ